MLRFFGVLLILWGSSLLASEECHHKLLQFAGERHSVISTDRAFTLLDKIQGAQVFHKEQGFLPIRATIARKFEVDLEKLEEDRLTVRSSAAGVLFDLLLSNVSRLVGASMGHRLQLPNAKHYDEDSAQAYFLVWQEHDRTIDFPEEMIHVSREMYSCFPSFSLLASKIESLESAHEIEHYLLEETQIALDRLLLMLDPKVTDEAPVLKHFGMYPYPTHTYVSRQEPALSRHGYRSYIWPSTRTMNLNGQAVAVREVGFFKYIRSNVKGARLVVPIGALPNELLGYFLPIANSTFQWLQPPYRKNLGYSLEVPEDLAAPFHGKLKQMQQLIYASGI